jgi:hypothetical protein
VSGERRPGASVTFRDFCPNCAEPVLYTDEAREIGHLGADGSDTARWWHLECALRILYGSVGHQMERCECYGGTEEDPPDMTAREAAVAAVAAVAFHDQGRRGRGSA